MIVHCKPYSTFSNKIYESSEEGGFRLIKVETRMVFSVRVEIQWQVRRNQKGKGK